MAAKKINKKASGRKRSDAQDESDLVKRNEYFTKGGQKFVRFPSGDVIAITPRTEGSAGMRGTGRFFGGGLTNRGK
jgi:hypothetical protein